MYFDTIDKFYMMSTVNEDGETVPNYFFTGKGNAILSGSRHFYDDLGNEIGSAEFSNGDLDAAHCSSFSFTLKVIIICGKRVVKLMKERSFIHY